MSIKKLFFAVSILIFSIQTAVAENISISGSSYQPGTKNITSGTTVTWTNMDATLHTVTSDTGFFDSGALSQGQVFSFTFNTAGTFNYHCNFHSFMHGTIIVLAATPAPVLTTITISPSAAALTVNGTQMFNATAENQNGAPMAGINITWTSSNMTVGNIAPLNAITGADGNSSAMFTANALGAATVNAINSTVMGSATVAVRAIGLPPEVAIYDTDHNGVIEKNEAVAAVVDYFAGNIMKAVAIEVVVAYFSP
ncbi:Cupredoxin-like domain protein [uncultured archaeon]|nr:Cupredoxin-like domain protein [uncultured archaeon]